MLTANTQHDVTTVLTMMLYYLGSNKKEGVYKFSMGAPSPSNFNPVHLIPQIQSCGYERLTIYCQRLPFS